MCDGHVIQTVDRGDSVDVRYTGWLFENNGIGKVSLALHHNDVIIESYVSEI